jgi:hypothetical protein
MSLSLGTSEMSRISMFASLGTTVDATAMPVVEPARRSRIVTGAGSRTRVVCQMR